MDDVTLGRKILDCPHGFIGNFRYVRAEGQWYLFSWAELPAPLVIERNGDEVRVDARPSDAIALGIANDTPIFIEEHVLDEVAGPSGGASEPDL